MGGRVDKDNWKVIRTQVLKHFSGAKKCKRGGSDEDVRRGAAAEATEKKSRGVRVIEKEEVRGNDQSNTSPLRVGNTISLSESVMTVEVLQNQAISNGSTKGEINSFYYPPKKSK